jgi:hypothetical protein
VEATEVSWLLPICNYGRKNDQPVSNPLYIWINSGWWLRQSLLDLAKSEQWTRLQRKYYIVLTVVVLMKLFGVYKLCELYKNLVIAPIGKLNMP